MVIVVMTTCPTVERNSDQSDGSGEIVNQKKLQGTSYYTLLITKRNCLYVGKIQVSEIC